MNKINVYNNNKGVNTMALFIYGTATNTGKGFFTHQDRQNFYLSGQPANVWVVGNNEKGALWLAEKNGVEKTKTEAQALVTAEVTAAQDSVGRIV